MSKNRKCVVFYLLISSSRISSKGCFLIISIPFWLSYSFSAGFRSYLLLLILLCLLFMEAKAYDSKMLRVGSSLSSVEGGSLILENSPAWAISR